MKSNTFFQNNCLDNRLSIRSYYVRLSPSQEGKIEFSMLLEFFSVS